MVRVALRGEARELDLEGSLRGKELADAEMTRLLPRLNIVEQTAVRHVVARAQKAARLRERMRAWVTRVLGMLREAVLDADRRLLRLVPELDVEARALEAGLGGRGDPERLLPDDRRAGAGAAVRAADWRRSFARAAPSTRAIARGPIRPSRSRARRRRCSCRRRAATSWRGLPASAGVVEGRARVLFAAGEMGRLEPGEVLVVHTTDVGWTPLFLIAAGVVTELGGPLSHAAVVAREFGVPSVVNVSGITRAIRTGDRLRVDGDRGVVERLERG